MERLQERGQLGQWLGGSLRNTNSGLHTPLYARTPKRQSSIKNFVGETTFERLSVPEEGEGGTKEADYRKELGYVIEERTYCLLDEGDVKYRAQYSQHFPGANTRPDIILKPDLENLAIEALIDITAEANQGHVKAKAGGGWFKKGDIVWVAESLYPSFDRNKAYEVVIKMQSWMKGISAEKIEEEKKKREATREQAEKRRQQEVAKVTNALAVLKKEGKTGIEALKIWRSERDTSSQPSNFLVKM